jgi:hypothetical protein
VITGDKQIISNHFLADYDPKAQSLCEESRARRSITENEPQKDIGAPGFSGVLARL